MNQAEVLQSFRDAGALLEGHFIYTSGRHGKQFLQAARVLQYPKHTENLCKEIATRFSGVAIDLVVGPATGGIVLSYETARHLNARAAYSEKDGAGMSLKRGFRLDPGSRVLVVEDIVTTGGSVLKTVEHLHSRDVEVVGVAVLIDRSAGAARFPCRFEALACLELESFDPATCPLCAEAAPLVEPDDLLA